MRHILVIGAGKSTSVLIAYLLEKSQKENIFLTIGDLNLEQARKLCNNEERCKAIYLDVFDKDSRENAIKEADIIISMLPARFHIEAAKD